MLQKSWDLVIDLQNNRRSKRLLPLIKKKKKVGTFRKPYLKRVLRLIARIGKYSEEDMVVARYLAAAGIGYDVSRPQSCRLFFKSSVMPEHIREQIYTGDIIRPIIALIPFAAWKNKEWPQERFVNVGKYFLVKGWDVCIMGGAQEMQKAEEMARQTGHRCFSLAGKLSLYECGCFLKKCSLALVMIPAYLILHGLAV
jgi:ADP-heptose:LPS heptosyltransferase